MTSVERSSNRVRERRAALGLTQAALAASAGISRTAVTAIEGNRLVPSVAAALAIAQSLHSSVEELFGTPETATPPTAWAWQAPANSPSWQAEILGRNVHYPASSSAMISMLPDYIAEGVSFESATKPTETLVMASCDPAAGILASKFQSVTGMRMIVLPRSSRQSLEMLRQGFVHVAGLHLSTAKDPDRNSLTAKESLGSGFRMIRVASWREGIVVAPSSRVRSVRSAVKAKMNWIGREIGSGARQCLDSLFDGRPRFRRIARDHHGVVEAVRSGWADAGVCVELVGREAGLDFLPVQAEAYDLCFPLQIADDRRVKSLLTLLRSPGYTDVMQRWVGYDTQETGSVWDL